MELEEKILETLGKNCHHPVYFPKNETYCGHNINWKAHEFQVSENETLRDTLQPKSKVSTSGSCYEKLRILRVYQTLSRERNKTRNNGWSVRVAKIQKYELL